MKFFVAEGLSRKAIAALFVLKIFTGILLFLIYTRYYTDRRSADIFKYFDDSEIIYNAIFVNPLDYLQLIFGINTHSDHLMTYLDKTWFWFKPHDTQVYNDNRSIIRFNAIARLFSFGYYQAHNVFMNFISLSGLVALYKSFSPDLKNSRKALAAAVFFVPSVLFWGSGVLKEGMLFFGLGFLIYHFMRLCRDRFSLSGMIWMCLMIFLLFICKFYLVIALLPSLCAFYWVSSTGRKYALPKYAATVCVLFLIGLNLHKIAPVDDLMKLMVRKQNDFVNLADSIESGSRFEISRLEPTLVSFMRNTPEAIAVTFLKPHIFGAKNAFMLMASLENLVVLCALAIGVVFFRKRDMNVNLLYFCATYVVILYVIIGLVTPVTGAIVRYKAPALPFLFITLILLADNERIIETLNKAKRTLTRKRMH